jgi:hypothetical protein
LFGELWVNEKGLARTTDAQRQLAVEKPRAKFFAQVAKPSTYVARRPHVPPNGTKGRDVDWQLHLK